jgi:DNA (cytosine-5)-methyltransferase 1
MRALDLFSGAAGGWSLGLHRAGYRTVAAAESDPWRRAAFLHNNPGVEMFDDVRAVTARSLRERLGCLPEIVVGSPPCQDISAANHRATGVDGERSGLFFEAVRIIGEVRPVWFALENSPRLRTLGYDRVADELEATGYACEPLVVGADDVLSPHRRDRVWVVGYRPDTHGEGQSGGALDGEMARLVGTPRYAYRERLAVGQGFASDACAKLAAIVRAVGTIGAAFGAGPAGHFRVADGVSDRLARECIAAYGDAVLPQIPEAIGRVMARLVPWSAAA